MSVSDLPDVFQHAPDGVLQCACDECSWALTRNGVMINLTTGEEYRLHEGRAWQRYDRPRVSKGRFKIAPLYWLPATPLPATGAWAGWAARETYKLPSCVKEQLGET